MDQGSHGSRGHLTRRVELGSAFGFSLLTTYLLLQPGATTSESTPLGDFRGYFPDDQLTYAGIASNAAGGNFSLVEPFTETGVSYYPSLWYLVVGAISRAFGVGVPAVWTVLGSLVIALAVIVVGYTAYRVSGRWWAPALVGPALWIGPIAMAIGEGWYLPLQSHALLWGPYGELFSLNAEAVGICAGAIALMLLLLASLRPPRSSSTAILVGVVGLIVGLLANIHTYSFLVTLGFLAAWVAVIGIGSSLPPRRRRLVIASIAIIIGVAVVGTAVEALRETLAMYGLMLLAAVPGGIVVLRRVPRLVFIGTAGVTVAAAPQIIHVLQGVAANDPFLVYRQVQSGTLNVGLVPFIVATLPIALWVLALTIAARRAHLPLPIASSVGAGLLALTLLSFNNVWGFVQEPYRMWIASLTLVTLLAVPLTAWMLGTGQLVRSSRTIQYTSVAALVMVALSWWNIGGFRAFVNDLQPISFDSSRLTALGTLTQNRGGLLTSDPCVDPRHLKIVSRERVAFYSAGLAWPTSREILDPVIENRNQGVLDPAAMRRAGVTHLVTDSTCPSAWDGSVGSNFVLLDETPYTQEDNPGVLRLWLLQ